MKMLTRSKIMEFALLLAIWTLLVVWQDSAWAASHSDAPLIKQDPQANITDVYAFIGSKYDDPNQNVLNVVVQVRPFSEPGDGVIYDRFADDALYSIHIADPNTGETVLRYNYQFSSVTGGTKNRNTILSYGLGTEAGPIVDIGDARQNFVQTYSVTKIGKRSFSKLGRRLLTPAPNVGNNVTPAYNDIEGRAVSGATDFEELDTYTRQTIYDLPSGEAVFAGPPMRARPTAKTLYNSACKMRFTTADEGRSGLRLPAYYTGDHYAANQCSFQNVNHFFSALVRGDWYSGRGPRIRHCGAPPIGFFNRQSDCQLAPTDQTISPGPPAQG